MCPEMLHGRGYGLATDFWSLGCLVYEMLVGLPPFMHKDKTQLYKLIKYQEPYFDFSFLSEQAKDLCKKLLEKNPLTRLGSENGVHAVMDHLWF